MGLGCSKSRHFFRQNSENQRKAYFFFKNHFRSSSKCKILEIHMRMRYTLCKIKVQTSIVRVLRAETRLTVYRSVAVRNRLGTPMGGTPQLLSMKKCDENQKLFVRSQLWSRKSGKGLRICLNLQF